MYLEEKIRSLLIRHHFNFSEYKKSFVIDCPKCGKEAHTWLRKSDGRTVCWKCSSYWNAIGIMTSLLKLSQSEVSSYLYGVSASDNHFQLNLDFEVRDDDHEPDLIQEFKPFFLSKYEFLDAFESPTAMDYLASRGVKDLGLIRKYGVLYNAIMNAVVFPVMRNGILYGYQARMIAPQENAPRMHTPSGFQKAHFLANYDRAHLEKNLILTEGMFDCLHADLPGYGAVCSFGKAVSDEQIHLINVSRAENVYIALDRDAFIEAQSVFDRIKNKKVFRLLPPDHRGDLGECTEEEVSQAIDLAFPMESVHLEVFFSY